MLRRFGNAVGVHDDYVWFGALVAPSFLLIGFALLVAGRSAGRWARAVGWLTMVGAPAVVVSYSAYTLDDPWNSLWGVEIPLLLAIGGCAVIAALIAHRARRLPGWWTALLASTPLILLASTAAFTYFPHGSLVGYGIEVAALAAGASVGSSSALQHARH